MKLCALYLVALAFAVFVSFAPAATPATEPAAPSSAKAFTGGSYTITSYKSSDSATHSGSATIKKQGDIFAMDVKFEDGEPLQGVAVYQNGELWAAVGQADTMGLAVYKIDKGNLAGTTYNISGDATKFGSESMTGSKDIAGKYNITAAKAPFTGDAYAGTVAIHPVAAVKLADAPVYRLAWDVGDYKAQGVGFKSGDKLIAATSTGPEWAVVRFKIDPATGAMTGDFYNITKAVGSVMLHRDGN